jgi:hypothetical protein
MRIRGWHRLLLALLIPFGTYTALAAEPEFLLPSTHKEGNSQRRTITGNARTWENLQRIPLGSLLLIEQTDGKRRKGRLVSTADNALTIQRRRALIDVPRCGIVRVWLLGDREVARGALVGLATGGVVGAVLGATHHGEEPAARFAMIFALALGGIGAGIGAGVGATLREQTLVYRAPPSGALSATGNFGGKCVFTAVRAPGTGHPRSLDSLPAPLRRVYRRFSAEQVARELAPEAE